MLVRKAKLTDIPQIVRLALQIIKYHETFHEYWTLSKNAKTEFEKHFKKRIHSKNKLLLVATDGEKIVGYGTANLKKGPSVLKYKKIGEVDVIMVDKRYRRQGISGLFMKEMMKWFRKNKMEFVEMTVSVKNDPALKAWEKYGFQERALVTSMKLR